MLLSITKQFRALKTDFEAQKASEEPKPKPAAKPPKPSKELVADPLQVLWSERRDRIGIVQATAEQVKIKSVPRAFQDVFLRNAVNDDSRWVYYIIHGNAKDPQLLIDGFQDLVSSSAADQKDKIGELKVQIGDIQAGKEEHVELRDAKLQAKAAAKANGKKSPAGTKKAVAAANAAIDEADGKILALKGKIASAETEITVLTHMRHTTKDCRLMIVGPFSSLNKTIEDEGFDFRAYILGKMDGCSVTAGDTDVLLQYRPSSVGGILLAKFLFTYNEEGNWEDIFETFFLQPDDTMFDHTEPLPLKKSRKPTPDFDDIFYVHVAFVLGTLAIPPRANAEVPNFELQILLSLSTCSRCGSTGHQSRLCPVPQRKKRD